MPVCRLAAKRRLFQGSHEPQSFDLTCPIKKSGGLMPSAVFGGDKGIRTPDLYVANVSRYQLCYIPVLVGTAELESATSCMSSKRSNQLSYAPVKYIYFNNFKRTLQAIYCYKVLFYSVLFGSSTVQLSTAKGNVLTAIPFKCPFELTVVIIGPQVV